MEFLKKATKSGPRLLAAFLAAILIYFTFGGDSNLYRLWQLKRKSHTLKEDIRLGLQRNKELRERIHRLDSDLRYLEKVAREKYSMGYDGEQIYRDKRD